MIKSLYQEILKREKYSATLFKNVNIIIIILNVKICIFNLLSKSFLLNELMSLFSFEKQGCRIFLQQSVKLLERKDMLKLILVYATY